MSSNRTARYLSIALLFLSLLVAFAGISRLTFLRPSANVAFQSEPTRTAVVLTGKNLLESTGDKVTIRATGPAKQEVFLGIALTADAQAFAKSVDHLELTDFKADNQLASRSIKAKKTDSAPGEQTLPDGFQQLATPAQSDTADLTSLDIWKQSAHGTGKASLTWQLSDNRWSAVAFVVNPPDKPDKADKSDKSSKAAHTPKATGPQLELKWKLKHEPSSFWGILLVIVGIIGAGAIGTYLTLLVLSERRSRAKRLDTLEKDQARQIASQVTSAVTGDAPTDTGVIPAVHPTRRSLRMAEEAENRTRRAKKTRRRTEKEEPKDAETEDTNEE